MKNCNALADCSRVSWVADVEPMGAAEVDTCRPRNTPPTSLGGIGFDKLRAATEIEPPVEPDDFETKTWHTDEQPAARVASTTCDIDTVKRHSAVIACRSWSLLNLFHEVGD